MGPIETSVIGCLIAILIYRVFIGIASKVSGKKDDASLL